MDENAKARDLGEIGQRLDAIRMRIKELEDRRRDDAGPDAGGSSAPSGRLAPAQRHAVAAQAAAERAAASCVSAFRRAADAHESLAIQHDRSAVSGFGDVAEHQRRAACHRAAAAADRQRAEHAQSLISGRAPQAQHSDERDGGPQGCHFGKVAVVSVPLEPFDLAYARGGRVVWGGAVRLGCIAMTGVSGLDRRADRDRRRHGLG